jgi:hypothetical protein
MLRKHLKSPHKNRNERASNLGDFRFTMCPLQNTKNSYSADAIPALAIRRSTSLQPSIVELEKSLV